MIALITPTGGRPKQIKLCAEWMRKQTYAGEVLWVIVDDCSPTTIEFITGEFRKNWTIIKVYPTPKWQVGQNTQARNLLAAINIVKKYSQVTSVFVIEDDDYYHEDYLVQMAEKLDGYVAAAQKHTVYFNLQSYTVLKHNNTKHGSLFQTAFTKEILPLFEEAVKTRKQFIDIYFWKTLQNKPVNLFILENNLAVGIKGMEGRKGIGKGHTVHEISGDRLTGLLKLKKVIGTDYLKYV